jgi:hypothetical protein
MELLEKVINRRYCSSTFLVCALLVCEALSQNSVNRPNLSLEDAILVNEKTNKFLDEPMEDGLRKSIGAIAILYLKNANHTRIAHAFFTKQKHEYYLNTSVHNVTEIKTHPVKTIYLPIRKEWIDISKLQWDTVLGGNYRAKLPKSFIALPVLKKAEKLDLIYITNTFQPLVVSKTDDVLHTASLMNFGSVITSIVLTASKEVAIKDFINISCEGISGSPVFVKRNESYIAIGINEGAKNYKSPSIINSYNTPCKRVNTVQKFNNTTLR